MTDLRLAREEVRRWDASMLERPQLVAATKRDAVGDEDPLPGLRAEALELGLCVVPVSAVSGEGLVALKRELLRLIATAPALRLGDDP